MPRVGFEPTILAGERPKIYALDRAATGIGMGMTMRNTLALDVMPCAMYVAIYLMEPYSE